LAALASEGAGEARWGEARRGEGVLYLTFKGNGGFLKAGNKLTLTDAVFDACYFSSGIVANILITNRVTFHGSCMFLALIGEEERGERGEEGEGNREGR
jgi:hypothetical protein